MFRLQKLGEAVVLRNMNPALVGKEPLTVQALENMGVQQIQGNYRCNH